MMMDVSSMLETKTSWLSGTERKLLLSGGHGRKYLASRKFEGIFAFMAPPKREWEV
jgi:hypothetical protein